MIYRFFPRLSDGILALTLVATAVFAQQEAPRPVYETNRNVGNVRFWNLLPPGSTPIDVVVPGEDSSPYTALPGSTPGSISGTTYWQFAPGAVEISIRQPGETHPLESITLRLRAGDYSTVIARADETTGKTTLSVIDDTYDFASEEAGEVLIFNSVPGIQCKVAPQGNISQAINVPVNKTVLVENLPLTESTLVLAVVVPEKPPLKLSIPLSFEDCRKAAVLIVRDRYQRLRPVSLPRGFINERAEMTTDQPTNEQ